MSCTKNPKKLLGISYRGNHKYEAYYFYRFMKFVSNNFIVKFRCKYCEAEYEQHFVTHAELLDLGFTNEEIKNK